MLLLYPLFLPLRADAVPWPLLLRSPVLPAAVLVLQLAGHFVILAEEQRCLQNLAPTMRST